MKMYNFTIIIPHFNIPQLLIRCINSIPDREDVQVIVVDDNSPDSDNYMSDYPELRKENVEFYRTQQGGSAGRARNVGIAKACGKWLIFADADDMFSENASTIFDQYVDAEEDLLFFKFDSVCSDNISQKSDRDGVIRRQMFESDNSAEFYRCKVPLVWSRFFRRELVMKNNIRFDETRWSNDYYFSICCGCAARTIKVVDEVLYVVTERKGSLVSAFCESETEMRCRADVSFRVQDVINRSPYEVSKLAVSINLLLILQKHPYMFKEYMEKLQSINVSKVRVLKEMCAFCRLRGKLCVFIKALFLLLK